MSYKDFVLLQSHLTPHPCGATQNKCQTNAALWVRPKCFLLFVAAFRLNPLGLQCCASIKKHLVRTKFV
ncbi:hypothetical protein N7931_05180, partial [Catenovulum sp. 2E275]|uniref:hypothetical protein n=1 Tax=Catenovulum sp. 2E275 TaxID=2980497 RepID=UPI0021D0A7E1